MIILGIDPGTTRAGYGLISNDSRQLKFIASGLLKTSSPSASADTLSEICFHLKNLISEFQPAAVGLEKLYFSKNQKTALAVSEARGALLLTLKDAGIPIYEFDPSEIKAAVTGNGRASKADIISTVKLILGNNNITGLDDTFDALAIAILTASSLKFSQKQ